jgi:hypothetical protein
MLWVELAQAVSPEMAARRLLRSRRSVRTPFDAKRIPFNEAKERVHAHLCDQYEPIDVRRLAYELEITRPQANMAIKLLLAEQRVAIVGTENLRRGPPTRLFVAL